jgi:hypothetical protein
MIAILDAILIMTIVYVVKFKSDFSINNINKVIAVLSILVLIALGLSTC